MDWVETGGTTVDRVEHDTGNSFNAILHEYIIHVDVIIARKSTMSPLHRPIYIYCLRTQSGQLSALQIEPAVIFRAWDTMPSFARSAY